MAKKCTPCCPVIKVHCLKHGKHASKPSCTVSAGGKAKSYSLVKARAAYKAIVAGQTRHRCVPKLKLTGDKPKAWKTSRPADPDYSGYRKHSRKSRR